MTEGTHTPSRRRRSYPNLHNLSLAPLSSKYPLDASAPPSPEDAPAHTPRTSYIAQKSAPTTPGILSLSQSRSNSRSRGSRHRAPKPIYAYDSYFANADNPVRADGEIPKAKSTSTLHPAGVSFADPSSPLDLEGARHHVRKTTAPLPLRMPLIRHHTSDAADEWIHRAGLAIAGETRDSKGQGWLVRRESSTSLVDDEHPHPRQLLSGESIDTDEYPTFSPRMSRTGSRLPSRIASRNPSARQSRRGSRAGSRADLAMTSAGLGSAYASARQSLEIPEFDEDDSRFAQPDFVEADEESSGDEEEVARLARERGFGMGSWMDRLIGWTLFSVDEDGEVSSSEDEDDDGEQLAYQAANMTKEEMRLRREVEAKRRKLEREAIIAASAVGGKDGGMEGGPVVDAAKPPEDGDGWQDAAWLLSVASKAMF